MISQDNSDEGDIIAETPQKTKQKESFRKLRISRKINTLSTVKIENNFKENNQHYLSNEFCTVRNYGQGGSTIKLSVKNVNVIYKRPYVFYEIKEVLNFTELYQPCNINIKMCGIYKQNRTSVHYLMEFKKSCSEILPMKILIDFKLSNSFPVKEQAIEVYGFLKVCKNVTKTVPVFMVNFWTNINCDFNRYLECLRQQQVYIPGCYKKMNTHDDELRCRDINNSIHYTFDEIDESCLVKNVENLEQICQEIDQIMNISEDIFQ